jgi:hypothetical protein
MSDTYFSTLSGALEKANDNLLARGFELTEDGKNDLWRQFCIGGISYEESKTGSFEIAKNGKVQRKAQTISIYRMGSGTYELTDYVN